MRDLLVSAGLGVGVNFPWEMAHSLLYRDPPGFTWGQHLACCGLASLADGLGIAAIFALGALAFGDPRWTRRRTTGRVLFAALLGLAGAAVTEWLALRLGWWGYGPAMPRVPGTNLGVSPLAQFVLLPLLVLFWALPRRWSHRGERDGVRV
jgi:hypothetical protein